MLNTADSQAATEGLPRVLLWSIRYQDQLAYYMRLYLFGAATFVLLLGFCQVISWDSALEIIFIAGMTFSIGLGLFIYKRRSWLLHITDKDLKREAYETMLAYIAAKEKSTKQNTGRCRTKDCIR